MTFRLRDCVVLHASEVPACTAVIEKRFVGYCSLQYVTAGAVSLSYNRKPWHLDPGWIWPCNPGPHIAFHAAPGQRHWYHHHVAVRGPLLDHWRAEGLWPVEPQAAPQDAAFTPLFRRMVGAVREPTSLLLGINLLEQILLHLAHARREPVAEAWVERAKRLLAEPDDFRNGVAAVATACGLPPSTFRRAFQRAVGVSPRDFALTARLERARQLLLTTDDPIGAIAEQLGYRDVFFFSRQFHQRTGLSPRAFRATR